MKRTVLTLVGLLVLAVAAPVPHAQQPRAANTSVQSTSTTTMLMATAHPPVPRDLSQLWLAPAQSASGSRSTIGPLLSNAARLTADGDYTRALSIVSQPIVKEGPLGLYATYYAGVAQLHLNRATDALKSFRLIQDQGPVGFLAEGAALGEAEADEALSKPADAVRVYQRLLTGRLSNVEDVYMRLGRAAKAANDSATAADAFTHVFYEFPLGENAAVAGSELNTLTGQLPLTTGSQRYKVELGRAERLFRARLYPDARTTFEALRAVASRDDRDLLQLRVAECDYFTKRTLKAREALRPLAENSSYKAEALYYYALATRDAGEVQIALDLLDRVQREYSRESWAEDALDTLADYYLKKGIDDRADDYFRQLYERYPRGKNSERAAWKIGWTSYRAANYPDTVLVFERAAADFARSDYRPGWLYWAGRAHEQLGDLDMAEQRYTLAAADYMNSYYGRLALGRMTNASSARIVAARNSVADRAPSVPALPPNGPTVRELLSAGMFDDALNELQYAQKVWGDSPAIQATVAWTNQQQARTESGMRRFQLLRGAINTMRRAYPQFLTAGGEDLPREVLTVIFPIAYWDSIRTNAEQYGLDPYLVAALVAQESTFTADVKSYANAYGLMQLLPSTARQYARKLNLPYSSRLLVDAESNVRMGTAYLADKVREFGDVHLALASYNAGERAVHRWQAERPGLETDEFIDDIPYPQTQNYVKRILGTADDYRRVYGNMASIQGVETTRKPSVPAVATTPKKTAPAPKAPPKTSAPAKSARKG